MPGKLIDGSPTRVQPLEFEGIDAPAVSTKVRVLSVARLERGSRAERCLHGRFTDRRASASVVVRTSVELISVTAENASGTVVVGCFDSAGKRRENGRWCGRAYGRLSAGRLTDPRLDVLCRTRAGAQIGTAWVEAAERARYVVVSQNGYAEAYETGGGVPVRIASTRDVDGSRAAFDISEHGADGGLLRSYRLEAYVAG